MSESISSEEYAFLLRLVGEARVVGLAELEYKGLKLRLRPVAEKAENSRNSITAQALTWSGQIPRKE